MSSSWYTFDLHNAVFSPEHRFGSFTSSIPHFVQKLSISVKILPQLGHTFFNPHHAPLYTVSASISASFAIISADSFIADPIRIIPAFSFRYRIPFAVILASLCDPSMM